MTGLEVRAPVCLGCAHPYLAHHGPPAATAEVDADEAAGRVWPGGACVFGGCRCEHFELVES